MISLRHFLIILSILPSRHAFVAVAASCGVSPSLRPESAIRHQFTVHRLIYARHVRELLRAMLHCHVYAVLTRFSVRGRRVCACLLRRLMLCLIFSLFCAVATPGGLCFCRHIGNGHAPSFFRYRLAAFVLRLRVYGARPPRHASPSPVARVASAR